MGDARGLAGGTPPDESPAAVAGGAAGGAASGVKTPSISDATGGQGYGDYKVDTTVDDEDNFMWFWHEGHSATHGPAARKFAKKFTKKKLIDEFGKQKYRETSNQVKIRIMRESRGKPAAIKIYENPTAFIEKIHDFNNGWYQKASQ